MGTSWCSHHACHERNHLLSGTSAQTTNPSCFASFDLPASSYSSALRLYWQTRSRYNGNNCVMKPLDQQVVFKTMWLRSMFFLTISMPTKQMSIIMSSRPRQPGRYHMLKANVLVPSAPSATTCTCTVFLGVDVIQALWE